jgi:hypothetical protein
MLPVVSTFSPYNFILSSTLPVVGNQYLELLSQNSWFLIVPNNPGLDSYPDMINSMLSVSPVATCILFISQATDKKL